MIDRAGQRHFIITYKKVDNNEDSEDGQFEIIQNI